MKAALVALALSGANALVAPHAKAVSATAMQAATLQVAPATTEALATAANEARGLAMDSIAAAASGHLGLPLGSAEMGAVLFGQSMTYNPDDPTWVNRDRFVLSAGHGSMFLYSWLHLAGYDLPKDEVANFRQHHAMTPGHPEFPNSEHATPGVEATTGPLGAGVSNCAGIAAASKMSAELFNTKDHTIFDNHIFCIVGDGCLQEGVSSESACFAAHEKLDNLIVLYDANDVTLDKMAEFTQSEDVGARYEAYGWDVITLLDGHDLTALYEATEEAKANNNGKPTLIICKTEIGRGIEEVAGTNAAHGEAGVAYVDAARAKLGLPEEKWFVSDDTYASSRTARRRRRWATTRGRRRTARGGRPTRTRPRSSRTASTRRRRPWTPSSRRSPRAPPRPRRRACRARPSSTTSPKRSRSTSPGPRTSTGRRRTTSRAAATSGPTSASRTRAATSTTASASTPWAAS